MPGHGWRPAADGLVAAGSLPRASRERGRHWEHSAQAVSRSQPRPHHAWRTLASRAPPGAHAADLATHTASSDSSLSTLSHHSHATTVSFCPATPNLAAIARDIGSRSFLLCLILSDSVSDQSHADLTAQSAATYSTSLGHRPHSFSVTDHSDILRMSYTVRQLLGYCSAEPNQLSNNNNYIYIT